MALVKRDRLSAVLACVQSMSRRCCSSDRVLLPGAGCSDDVQSRASMTSSPACSGSRLGSSAFHRGSSTHLQCADRREKGSEHGSETIAGSFELVRSAAVVPPVWSSNTMMIMQNLKSVSQH